MQASLGTAARYLGVSTTQSPSKEISAKEESLRFSPKLRINQNVTQKVGLQQIFTLFTLQFETAGFPSLLTFHMLRPLLAIDL